MAKTHYRNAFKSDHLASADVEELIENNGRAILTISKVELFKNRKVAGRTKDKGLVAFFKEKDTKPMIINSHNAEILKSFYGSSYVEDWQDKECLVELYVDYDVKLSGSIVSGIRFKRQQPKAKELPSIDGDRFDNLLKANKEGRYSKQQAIQAYSLTKEQIEKLK